MIAQAQDRRISGPRNGNGDEFGQSLVELALMLPVILLILFGTLDFGRLYFSYVTITNAARVGAEFGMDARRNQTDVLQMIKDEAKPHVTLADADITMTANPSWSAGSELTVEVKTRFYYLTPVISNLLGGGPLTLTSRVISRFNPA